MAFKQHLINAGIGALGQALRLPEMGFSERIAYGYGKPAAPQASVNTGQVQGVSYPQPQNYSQNTNNFSPVANTYQKAAQRQQAQPQQRASSGGGGNPVNTSTSSGGDSAGNGGYSDTSDENRLIDEAYSASESYLNSAEQNLRNDFPSVTSQIEGQHQLNERKLNDQLAGANTVYDQRGLENQKKKENALESARRMFSERAMGANQRFGGSSSAGNAMSEILAREQASQFGKTGRQATDIQHEIETQRQQTRQNFDTELFSLIKNKEQGIATATSEFNQKLLSIQSNRAMIGQARAEAKITALQTLRNQVMQISQQNDLFTKQLQLYQAQASGQLDNYASKVLGSTNSVNNLTNATQFNADPFSSFVANKKSTPLALTGQITNRRRDDEYSNPFA